MCPCKECTPYCPSKLPAFSTSKICSFCKNGLHSKNWLSKK